MVKGTFTPRNATKPTEMKGDFGLAIFLSAGAGGGIEAQVASSGSGNVEQTMYALGLVIKNTLEEIVGDDIAMQVKAFTTFADGMFSENEGNREEEDDEDVCNL